jgi:membrane protein DedA with SNARE-associated domain
VLEGAVEQLTPWFRDWGIWLILVATFLESSIIVASFVPGESVLLLGGFFSASNPVVGGEPVMQLEAVVTVAFLGAFLGDMFGFAIGRRYGDVIVRKFGRFVFLSPDRMPVLEAYFRDYGKRAVLFGRFAPFLRSVRTLVAGTAGMPFRAFVLPAFVGAAAWSALVAVTGFLLSESYRVAENAFGTGGLIILVLLIGAFALTWRNVRRRVQRELAAATDGPSEMTIPQDPTATP